MNQTLKIKIFLLLVFALFVFFFTNDFGLVDIEKTAIITAIGIDKAQDDSYEITAEIAVPEATDTNTESQKTIISSKGSTVGYALKSLSDLTGWYPQLTFCNLIVISSDFENENLISMIDYFAKTLRIQDSALVIYSEGKAKDLFKDPSPLDGISSFALQKILIKNQGFDKTVATNNIKDFCVGYYLPSASSYMPIVSKVETQNNSQSGSGSSSGGNSGGQSGEQSDSQENTTLFTAKKTALFKDGIKVGVLENDLTLTYNMLKENIAGTVLRVDNVNLTENSNYLLTVIKNKPNIKIEIQDNKAIAHIDLKIYCKISDQNTTQSNDSYLANKPIPEKIKSVLKSTLLSRIQSLFDTIKETECDIFGFQENLYRYHNKYYAQLKDSILQEMSYDINIEIEGQK